MKFAYTEIALNDLTSTDLREEAESFDAGTHAYRITLYDDAGVSPHPEAAEALVIGDRTGIAWGSDAEWGASFGTIEQDISAWLDGEWADRN